MLRWIIVAVLAIVIGAGVGLWLLPDRRPAEPARIVIAVPASPTPAALQEPVPQSPATSPELRGGRFVLPVDCQIGTTCWVINYFDVDTGPAAQDFRCRPRTYEGHDGVDIAIRDLKEMARGIAVLAAADGVVRAVRDGEIDGLYMEKGKEATTGRQCGNGVVIEHGDGWQTQYCHMRRGSVSVQPGTRVADGDRLGLIGLSGDTEWPHLHVMIRKDNVPLDPFTGRAAAAGCSIADRMEPLWATTAGIDYEPVQIFAAGFLARAAIAEHELMKDSSGDATIAADADVVVLWAAIFGADAGDRVTFRLLAPSGATLAETVRTMDRSTAVRVPSMVLRRTGAAGWATGRYRGVATLERTAEGGRVFTRSREATVEIR